MRQFLEFLIVLGMIFLAYCIFVHFGTTVGLLVLSHQFVLAVGYLVGRKVGRKFEEALQDEKRAKHIDRTRRETLEAVEVANTRVWKEQKHVIQ